MKTRTGVSLTKVAIDLLAIMCELMGVSRSAAIEIIVRDYARRNNISAKGK